jgi:serine protease Do
MLRSALRRQRNGKRPQARAWRAAVACAAWCGLAGAVCLSAARSDEGPTPGATAAASDSSHLVLGDLAAPRAFRAAAAKVLPSIVAIDTFGGLAPAAVERGALIGFGPAGRAPTTGLIVSGDGFIVTSTYNLLDRPPVITVTLRDGTRHVARLAGRDETRNICLLKIDGRRDLPVPEMIARDKLRPGQWAVSVGVGFGDAEPGISAGIVSATHRVFGRAVQTDANTSPANYGGPLVDIEGRVIGVCVPLSPASGELAAGAEWYDSGIGFAVPLAERENLLAALKDGRTIEPPHLGIKIASQGTIESVEAGSPAEQAGLATGDRIESVDGDAVLDAVHLRYLIGRRNAGDKVRLAVRRDPMRKEVEVRLGTMPKETRPAEKAPAENAPAEKTPED